MRKRNSESIRPLTTNAATSWNKISAAYEVINKAFRKELSSARKHIDDVAFLGAHIVETTKYYPNQDQFGDGRLLVEEMHLQINEEAPNFITFDQTWQQRIAQHTRKDISYHPTRHEVENGGKQTSCVMVGNNVMLFSQDKKRQVVQYVHQRDNHPSNPHRLCFGPPGGNCTEIFSQTAQKELQEELILFKRVRNTLVMPRMILPDSYQAINKRNQQKETEQLHRNLERALAFAAIKHEDFDGTLPLRIQDITLEPIPELTPLEGKVFVYNRRRKLIDIAKGMVIHTPKGNKIGILVPARLPEFFTNLTNRVFAVDGEVIPFLEKFGGRDVVMKTMPEIYDACKMPEDKPGRPLDLLKAAALRMKAAKFFP